MSTLANVITTIISTAAFIGCLWWAYSALSQLDIPRRHSLPAGIHLLAVVALGGLVYAAVARVLGGLYGVFQTYSNGWVRAFDVLGAIAVIAFVAWLYTRAAMGK